MMFPKIYIFVLPILAVHISASAIHSKTELKDLNEELLFKNEAFDDGEKVNVLKKSEVNLEEIIKPLPSEDVKCLTSSDDHCSKDMREIKTVLIEAIRSDCARCTETAKMSAARVMTALMAHHPAAWKTFLTRYDGLRKVQRLPE